MMMRKYDIENPYEKLKEFSRGGNVTRESVREFVLSLNMPKEDKTKLLDLTPSRYIGLAGKFAGDIKNYNKN